MAKSQNGPSFWAELLRFDLYKRNQGRLVRQLTAVGICILIFFGGYTLSQGPLSDYVNSHLETTVRYSSGGQPDSSLDSSLRELAGKYGGTVVEESQGRRFRELIVHFPTSTGWQTDPDLVAEMRESGQQFAEEVSTRFESRVRISQLRGQTRRSAAISIAIPVLLCLIGVWMVFRAVNYPRFADFLISVEAEMDKVSWPGKQELYRSTIVVVSTMFLLGFTLLAYDVFWKWFFELVGFLRLPTST